VTLFATAATVALFAASEPVGVGAGADDAGAAPAPATFGPVSRAAAAEEGFSAEADAYQIVGAVGTGATAALAVWLATGGLAGDRGASVRSVAAALFAGFGGWWLGKLAARGEFWARAAVWVLGVTGGVIVLGAVALIAVSSTVREVFNP
jgi:hypothetical protein